MERRLPPSVAKRPNISKSSSSSTLRAAREKTSSLSSCSSSRWDLRELETNFRKFTTSFTVALLEPRNWRTTCMNSLKFKVRGSPLLSSSAKMKSAKSTSPMTSTSTSLRASVASLLARICSNSTFDIVPSPSWSILVSTSCILFFTKSTVNVSFSVAATALTTSVRTPISMFIKVRAAKRTKSRKRPPYKKLTLPNRLSGSVMLSISVPYTNKVYIDSPTLLK
mmetsp:Transcript_8652/g.18881  ORF Transcript_8652/g.18881 Transcript_8652/m.18881 type:complete len:224 (+) Transcript_8652:1915-2586(+)